MWIAIAVAAVLLFWFILCYNSLVRLKALAAEAASGMDVCLKKRRDLVPNLVETVKGYMTHEQETLAQVVELRGKAVSAAPGEARIAAEGELSGALSRLFALAENYPELRADAQFLSLQNALRGAEDEIAQARKYYNGAARQFNIRIQTVPSSLVAALFRFTPYPYFEISPAEREPVAVDFSR